MSRVQLLHYLEIAIPPGATAAYARSMLLTLGAVRPKTSASRIDARLPDDEGEDLEVSIFLRAGIVGGVLVAEPRASGQVWYGTVRVKTAFWRQ